MGFATAEHACGPLIDRMNGNFTTQKIAKVVAPWCF